MVFAHLFVLTVIVIAVLRGLHPNQLSCFTKVISKETITGARHFRVFRFKIGGLRARPLETGKAGDFGLVVIKASEVTDFSDALTYLERQRGKLDPETLVIMNLSGRGDKDMDEFILRRDEQNKDSTAEVDAPAGPPNGLFC